MEAYLVKSVWMINALLFASAVCVSVILIISVIVKQRSEEKRQANLRRIIANLQKLTLDGKELVRDGSTDRTFEVLGVFFELTSLGIIAWACFTGIFNLNIFFSFLVLMAVSQALISVATLFIFLRDQRLLSFRYSMYLLFLSFFELFLYRWIITIAKAQGTFDYLRGVKTFDQYKRYIKKKQRPAVAIGR